MAARRLLIVMIVLLGLSTLAAALVPTGPRPGSDETTETQTETMQTQPEAAEGAPPGRFFTATVNARSRKVEVVPLSLGDQLSLQVRSGAFDQVELPAFGLVHAVGPYAPATFDLLADRPGTFAIRLVDAGRVVGRIRVTPSGAKPGPRRGRGTG